MQVGNTNLVIKRKRYNDSEHDYSYDNNKSVSHATDSYAKTKQSLAVATRTFRSPTAIDFATMFTVRAHDPHYLYKGLNPIFNLFIPRLTRYLKGDVYCWLFQNVHFVPL